MLPMDVSVLVVDGVVKLSPEANGAVVVGGSNATAYAAYYSARAGVRAAMHHDAGSAGMRRGSAVCLGRTSMAWLWRP